MAAADVQFDIFVEGEGAEEVRPEGSTSMADRVRLHRGVLLRSIPAKFPRTRTLPSIVYGRLVAPSLLELDRLLFLDVDILIRGRLDALLSLDMKGRTLAAAHDVGVCLGPKDDETTPSFRRSPYFNAGVLLIDCARWRKRDRLADAARFFDVHGPAASMQDQDFLNDEFRDDWIALSPRWNFQIGPLAAGFGNAVDPAIVHFNGSLKPWRPVTADAASTSTRAFRTMLEEAGLPGAWAPAGSAAIERSRFNAWRLALRAALYRRGVSTPRAEAQLNKWRAFRAEFESWVRLQVAQGAFADPFRLKAINDPGPPVFDGRRFYVRDDL